MEVWSVNDADKEEEKRKEGRSRGTGGGGGFGFGVVWYGEWSEGKRSEGKEKDKATVIDCQPF